MPSEYDATEFVDSDFQMHKTFGAASAAAPSPRAPSREEVDLKVIEAQQKLAELKRAQEELERERAALEETRRRQIEFQTGRDEMIQNLTRGLGLLEEAEFATRREAEQMAKAIAALREALAKVQALNEQSWTRDDFHVELTRALTTLENARLEWNSARLKFPVLTAPAAGPDACAPAETAPASFLGERSFAELCKLGLALTWPLTVVAGLTLGVLVVILLSR